MYTRVAGSSLPGVPWVRSLRTDKNFVTFISQYDIICLYECWVRMVAYFCHHLSDNYVDLSDIYVDLSDLYVDLSDLYVDLSLIPSVEK